MRTVSYEMAKKLKDAGLRWEPKIGDFHLQDNETEIRICQYIPPNKEELADRCLWLPTLSDLLEWLEGRGYWWSIHTMAWEDWTIKYLIVIYEKDISTEYFTEAHRIISDTPEKATAEAVLWVLEQEATNMGRR